MAPFYFSSKILEDLPFIVHGFFTRKGGVSTGDYESLNCKAAATLLPQEDGSNIEAKDTHENVHHNRDIIVNALGGKLWVGLRQKHTPHVHVIDDANIEKWQKTHTLLDQTHPPIGDALVTTLPNIVLSVITADCVPILLCDKEQHIIGAIHAGWKGSFDGIIENTIHCIRAKGAQHIIAAVGPCVHQDHFEVGPEFQDYFTVWLQKHLKNEQSFVQPPAFSDFFKQHNERFLFNLPHFAAYILKSLGVKLIDHINKDTYSQPDLFFSYRYNTHNKKTIVGCQASSIMLTSKK